MGNSKNNRNNKKPIFFSVRKSFLKAKCDSKTFSKSYSLRFIGSVRLTIDSLDSHVDNLTCNVYKTKCKHCTKSADCKMMA